MHRFAVTILFLSLCGCATLSPKPLSRDQIIERTKKEISKRETWAKGAQIMTTEDRDSKKWRWKVEVRALDLSTPASCGCIPFLPDGYRDLYFSDTGRLMIYQRP